jgi:regulator of RNase E activity RraA
MPQRVDPSIITGLREFDSATIFNALVQKLGLPNEEYTDHTIRCLLPELGTAVGYAVTAEVTTNDADSPALDWMDYYARPGRGASFGDGMATVHARLGVVGALVDGTVRDLVGIRRVGLPMWAWGTVPGHGVFHVTRIDTPITVGQLRIRPGDLIFADSDGTVRIPTEHAADILRLAGEVRQREAEIFDFYKSPDFSVQKMRTRR